MFIQNMREIIDAYMGRYMLPFPTTDPDSDFIRIESYTEDGLQKVEFFYKEYSQKAWMENGELNIINAQTGESVFDYAEEYSWSEEDVEFIKYGTKKGGCK